MKCLKCDDTGIFKRPLNVEKYEEEFDRLDAPGTLTMGECRDKALKYAGYEEVPCNDCSKGKVLKAYLDFRNETIKQLKILKNTFEELDDFEKINEVAKMVKEVEMVLERMNRQLKMEFNWKI